ncbi:MAG: VOC family protein [Chloroflexi bacterium]|nr:VOC family protein [Chloroflexota bacterium]MDA8219304.1 VOC family protein [Dehalococcoidales bacterium]
MSAAQAPRTKFRQIDQVCVVVRDVRAAMRNYWETVGIGPWKLYVMSGPRITERTYYGRPADFKFLMALASTGSAQFELIQPLEGDTVYQDFLDRHGEGVQHLGMLVNELDQEMANAEANGVAVIQSGRDREGGGRGGYAYLDTEGRCGTTFEFIQRRGGNPPLEPIETYP